MAVLAAFSSIGLRGPFWRNAYTERNDSRHANTAKPLLERVQASES